MSETRIFILVEAVNIDGAVFDTQQLSVVRGGSFLLKEAINDVEKRFESTLKPLSTGASSGFFVINEGVADGPGVCGEISKLLHEPSAHEPSKYRHFCFLVDWYEASGVQEAKERLLAKIRYRQMRALTQAPDPWETAGSPGPCELEGIRMLPERAKPTPAQDTPKKLSESVSVRFSKGREMRWQYYAREIRRYAGSNYQELRQKLNNYRFTRDFEKLAEAPGGRLDKKIAVVYFDGNGFTRIQQEVLAEARQMKSEEGTELDKEMDAQKRFDGKLKEFRARYLASLLEAMLDSEGKAGSALFANPTVRLDEESGKPPAIRLETLLWGGDEMLFVVPAWMGMDLVQHFYEKSSNWKVDGHRLTHSGGIVFCRAKTPIRIVRRLARELAERVKARKDGRKESQFDYLVLESIDYPAEQSLDAFFRMRYGDVAALRRPLRPVEGWGELKGLLNDNIFSPNGLPKRQLHRIAEALTRQDRSQSFGGRGRKGVGWEKIDKAEPAELSPFEMLERRILSVAKEPADLKAAMRGVFDFFGAEPADQRSRAWAWLHLLELWDYLQTEPNTASGATAARSAVTPAEAGVQPAREAAPSRA